ncbi:hypothetical protein ABZS79_23100 [Streptomyces griseoloalbus]|uniref:hypothetical protein n=1 Tax=Streptomyces griseoloalbus TaxID=67303 RepID=UPI0033B186C0
MTALVAGAHDADPHVDRFEILIGDEPPQKFSMGHHFLRGMSLVKADDGQFRPAVGGYGRRFSSIPGNMHDPPKLSQLVGCSIGADQP